MTPTSSASHDPDRLARKARRLGLFDALTQTYAVFPETRCGGCGACCFQSPGLFAVEYLRLRAHLATWAPEAQDALLHAAFRELLFAWIEPTRSCLFLDASRRCTLYELRPLACRLFGLTSPAEPELAQEELHFAAEEEADRLSWLGVEVPEATLTRAVASCRRVRSVRGRRPRLDADELAERVAALDAHLLPREVVTREYCFSSLPDRLGAAVFGEETVELLRLQVLRRAQRGEPVAALVGEVLRGVEAARLFGGSRRRKPGGSTSEGAAEGTR